MSRECSFVVLFNLFIIFLSASSRTTEAKLDKIDQLIVVEMGEDVELPCNPSLLSNSTLSSLILNVEWRTYDNIPIYTDGKVWPYLREINNDVDISSFAIYDHPPGTLILRHVSRIGNYPFKCTFFTRSREVSYTYLIQINRNHKYSSWYYTLSPIIGWEKNDHFVLPCNAKNSFGEMSDHNSDFSYVWLSRISRPNHREEFEVISLNRRILLKNNTNIYEVAENGSLIIRRIIPSWPTKYECHTSSNEIIVYYNTFVNRNNESDHGYSWNNTDITVEQGHDVSLKCPVGNANFVWIRNTSELLFVNERAVKSSRTGNLKIDYNKKLLNITKFSPSLSGTYTCSATNGENYQYNITKREGANKVFNGTDILGKDISLDCPLNSTADTYTVWTRKSRSNTEVLFINGLIASGEKNDKLKIANNGRTLLINDFSYTLGGVYVCRLDTGLNSTFNITVPDEYSDWTLAQLKKRSFSVEYESRNLVLPCPSMDKNNVNSSYQWFFSSIRNQLYLLFINHERYGYGSWSPHVYEIKGDGSLAILIMRRYQFGEYTCKRSTGEQYVYVLDFDYKWINETILIKNNTDSVTLPCPTTDPRDADSEISWVLDVPSVRIYGEFRFVDGKMLSPRPYITENIKIADDKTSLTVSNLTSANYPFNGEYTCKLIYSGRMYRYLLTN